MQLNVKRVNPDAQIPKHAKSGDAGMDLCTMESAILKPGETKMVGTGIAVEIPNGFVGLVFPRSGLGSKGVNLSNCVGVIDSSYRGEIKAPLHNNHPSNVLRNVVPSKGKWEEARPFYNYDGEMVVRKGERVCQLVIVPYMTCECVEVDELSDSERGEGGFGSTGRL